MEHALAEEARKAEAATRIVLPSNTYQIVRVDGNNFKNYTHALEAPFDAQFAADMDTVARELCNEMTGVILAYNQSDEISIVMSDLKSENTGMHLGGKVPKIVSLTAALTTAIFNEVRPGRRALFDARVFTFKTPEEVARYLLWRQIDGTRNSISMAARAEFSHREMKNVSSFEARRKLMEERGIDWADYDQGFRSGRLTEKILVPATHTFFDKSINEMRTQSFTRKAWQTVPAPRFSDVTEEPTVQSLILH